jgi:3alpha(or 20beta)-hydroxysteroid dehydrogenase
MEYGFAGRTVVVTGAARGQGAAEADILVREGARVIGADILDDEGRALAERLTAAGPGTMEYWRLDVSSEDQWAGRCTAWSTTRACPTERGCSTWTWLAGTG